MDGEAPHLSTPARFAVETTSDIPFAVEHLSSDGIVAFPTDTFYALGASALDAAAVARVFDAKKREPLAPVPVLISDMHRVDRFAREFPPEAVRLADRFWPGALTIVAAARDAVPSVVTAGLGTVGLRVPDNDAALELLKSFGGGITGTSANLSGEPPMKTAREVADAFQDVPGLILDGECGGHDAPSTVVMIQGGSIRILRHGAVSESEIEAAMQA